VVWPGDEARYAQAAAKLARPLHVFRRPSARLGHAIWCSREVYGKPEPFLPMVGRPSRRVRRPPCQRLQRLVEWPRPKHDR